MLARALRIAEIKANATATLLLARATTLSTTIQNIATPRGSGFVLLFSVEAAEAHAHIVIPSGAHKEACTRLITSVHA